ncbi:MAG: cbb3-type cytochrome c oxidase subunit I [Chitinophagaceae bacterium]
MRTKGMSMTRMPLTMWAFFFTAILGVLSFPVLLSGAILLLFDRNLGTSFYLSDIVINGKILPNEGGSPILFQHLFWFLGHPEVYIIILTRNGYCFRSNVYQFPKTNFRIHGDGRFIICHYCT